MLVPMTQPALPLPASRRPNPFALDEKTKRIGRAGVARAREALAQAARSAESQRAHQQAA